MPEVIINTVQACLSSQIDDVEVVYSGHVANIKQIVDCLNQNLAINQALIDRVTRNRQDFSLILKSKNYVFAMVDRIKSHPIYYTQHPDKNIVANCANSILSQLQNKHLSQRALTEFSMAGYVLGRDTLYDEIKQLQAGELLLWKQRESSPTVHRYYRYVPVPDTSLKLDDLIESLGNVFDKVMDNLIQQANGRPIFIPLSGGLDSRFLLTKLVEKKYDHITAFTYGINGNHEMKQAECVAKDLAIRWLKLPANKKRASRFFSSSQRQAYEQFSHALTTIPFYGEFEVLANLLEQKLIPDNAMIVNGQSGDFITGGHVRSAIIDPNASLDNVFDYIINKHFSLWLPDKTPENIDWIKTRLQIQFDAFSPRLDFPNFYEYWEWQERQCKNVVRGQRLYEFFGFAWNLPFWHADLMDFYARVPYSLKCEQRLYIEYLKRYNYKNMFDVLRKKVQPWVLKYRWIPVTAKFVQFMWGKKAKENYYKRKDYYSTYYHQYALYGHDFFLKHYKDIRNPESLILRDLLERFYL